MYRSLNGGQITECQAEEFGSDYRSTGKSLETLRHYWSFSGGSDGKESARNEGDIGLIPGLGRIPWRREWQPTPVFLPGEFHGQMRHYY